MRIIRLSDEVSMLADDVFVLSDRVGILSDGVCVLLYDIGTLSDGVCVFFQYFLLAVIEFLYLA